eukprot:scaffold167092_cov19-Tisochrysis_lutea.AAC.1
MNEGHSCSAFKATASAVDAHDMAVDALAAGREWKALLPFKCMKGTVAVPSQPQPLLCMLMTWLWVRIPWHPHDMAVGAHTMASS